jgi:hypothetical protein
VKISKTEYAVFVYYKLESIYKKSSKFEEVMVQNQKKNVWSQMEWVIIIARSPRSGRLGWNLISDSYAAMKQETIIKMKMRFCRLEHYNNKKYVEIRWKMHFLEKIISWGAILKK